MTNQFSSCRWVTRASLLAAADDKEVGETNTKKGEETTEIVTPTSWVDQVLAKLAKLKASVSMLHNALLSRLVLR